MTAARRPNEKPTVDASPAARRPSLVLRVAFVVIGLAAWFGTQALIGQRVFREDGIGDLLHQWTAPLHDALLANPHSADSLLIASSAVIDLVGISLLGLTIFGSSVRPFLALLMLFAMRQICQALCSLTAPDEMIWRSPGVPSLLVTYGVSTDLFFSGHTGLAVLGAVELGRLGNRWLVMLGVAIAIFEATTVLVLRAHYTMDVFTGAVTALLVSDWAARLAPRCDRWLASWSSAGR
jgi:hypothetical protein